MKKIKNIVFDFGGVILTDDDIGVLFDNEELMSKFPGKEKEFYDSWGKNWKDVAENRITIFEFYNNLQRDALGTIDQDLSNHLFETYKNKTHSLDPYMLLPKLKEKYKLSALTNIFKEGLEFKINKYKLDTYFDEIVSSCGEGISKADPRIFKILIKKSGINPKESLYIDDRDKNIIAAHDLGFEIFKYKEIRELKDKFSELGIIYE